MSKPAPSLTDRVSKLAEYFDGRAAYWMKHSNPDKAACATAAAKDCREIVSEVESMTAKLAIREKRGAFIPPTVPEIVAEMARWSLPAVEAERFFAHYESNGWKVGKNGMRSWKAAVVNWREGYFEKNPAARPKAHGASKQADPQGWREYLKARSVAYVQHYYAPDFLKREFKNPLTQPTK
jgi:hypothetical protein